MKAIVQEKYGSPDHLRLADIPIPKAGKGQLRVRVLACAVNLSDWEYLVGSPYYTRIVGGLFRPKQPVLGSDIVGVIDQIGSGVTGFSIGQRVMGDVVMVRGGFAEYACVAAADMAEVPDDLSDEIAACLPQAGGIAVAGTEGLKSGQTLLINGAGGGSGTMALQLAKAAGARVTVVDNTHKVSWLKALGADDVIDYTVQDFARTGRKWDRILDMVATRGPRQISNALNANGVYKAVGGDVKTLLSLVFGGMFFRFQKKSIGMLIVPVGQKLTGRVARMAVEKRITPHLEAVLPLADVPEAIARTGRGEVLGKCVIRPALT